MARYVVLRIEDNKDAEALIHDIESWGYLMANVAIPKTQAGETTTEKEIAVTVRSMYAVPTLFCSCPRAKNDHGFTRGKKYGWMVHAKCGKPTKAWATGDGWFACLGTNLLPVTEDRPEYRGIGKQGHHWNGQEWVPDAKGEGAGA